jgi:hypothetical protein
MKRVKNWVVAWLAMRVGIAVAAGSIWGWHDTVLVLFVWWVAVKVERITFKLGYELFRDQVKATGLYKNIEDCAKDVAEKLKTKGGDHGSDT